MRFKNAVVEHKCIECKRVFLRFAFASKGRRSSCARPSYALTCSHQCSVKHGHKEKICA